MINSDLLITIFEAKPGRICLKTRGGSQYYREVIKVIKSLDLTDLTGFNGFKINGFNGI